MQIIEGYPLSPQQRRLWRLRRRIGPLEVVARVKSLDRVALRERLQAVVQRHEILRTSFPSLPVSEYPVQRVQEDFDLDHGPGLRVACVNGDGDRLALIVPPLCADRSSLYRILLELNGCETDSPVQYAQFAEWMNSLVGSDSSGSVDLAVACVKRVRVSPAAGQAIYNRANRLSCRAEDILQACFFALLWRTNGEDTPIAAGRDFRDEPQLGSAVGPLLIHVPIAVPLQGSESFVSVVGQTAAARAAALGALETVASRSEDPKTPYGFECYVVPAQLRDPGGAIEIESIRAHSSGFRWNLIATLSDVIEIELFWDASAADEAEAGLVLERYLHLLEQAATSPDRAVGSFEIVGPQERELLLRIGSGCEIDIGERSPVHELIAAQAHSRPHVKAVASSKASLTYAQLDLRANQVASMLIRRGVPRGGVVGVQAGRSPLAVACILGVLKAGAAYLPLHKPAPGRRVEAILRDAQASYLITESDLDPGSELWQEPVRDLSSRRAELQELAYIIYTSGSTGEPKGVMVTHGNLLHSTRARQHYYEKPVSAFLLASPLAFDSSVAGFFWTLCDGGALVLADEDFQQDIGALVDTIRRNRVSHLLCLPSLYQTLLDFADELSGLAFVIVAGETCPASLVERHHTRLAGVKLFNEYGPTEATVWSTVHECATASGPVPIGAPIPNSRVHILDDAGVLAALGSSGEIHIGGSGVALGYRNDPVLTAMRFVPDPYNPGQRLYRTGDRGRVRADGVVEFLGRLDEQVKLRGYRIEPAEIEAAILSYAGVREAAVAPIDRHGAHRLVAFVAASQATTAALKNHAASQLPDYMVPSHFVLLDRLPRTPNGKIDRRALADFTHEGTGQQHVPPRSTMERLVAEAFCEALSLERVGVFDHFFELGGDSIRGIQLINRLQKRLGRPAQIGALMEAPTVEALARRLEASGYIAPENQTVDTSATPVAFQAMPRTGAKTLLPMSFAQERLWLLHRLDPKSTAYHLPAAFRISGPLHTGSLRSALLAVVERHEALRTTFVEADGMPMQIVRRRLDPEIQLVDIDADAVTREMNSFLCRPFDLGQGAPIRAWIACIGPREHVLAVVMHHMVSDAWSVGVLVRELSAFYSAAIQGAAAHLPVLSKHYADYAVWQRQSWETLEAPSRLEYWAAKLSGDLPPRLLEYDSEGGQSTPLSGVVRRKLPPLITTAAREYARGRSVTLFAVLLAAFEIAVHRISGLDEIVIGCPVTGREHPDVEGLIGLFINTVVLREKISPSDYFQTLVDRTARSVGEALLHEVPFDALVRHLRPERTGINAPLFHVLFALQNNPRENLSVADLRFEPLPLSVDLAKFDLTVEINETDSDLEAVATFRSDCYRQTTIQRLLSTYEQALRTALERPSQQVGHLSVFPPEEIAAVKSRSLAVARGTETDVIHSVFEEQARKTPAAPALRFDGTALTYRELNIAANQIARALMDAGVQPGEAVAICGERSIDLVPGLLGILKAGAAYVPVMPDDPEQRTARLFTAAGVRFVLAPASRADAFARFERTVLHSTQPRIATDPVCPRVHPESTAYILQTSGSTGEPKAVAAPHRAVVNLVRSTNYFDASTGDVVLHYAPLSFDACTFEIWGALLNGAQLAIVAPRLLTTAELAQAIRRDKVTILWLTAGLFRLMVREELSAIREVRQVLAGGETLPVEHTRRFLDGAEGTLVNGYGPTECTTFAACYRMPGKASCNSSVPIGFPISGCRVYILDPRLNPVPAGVVGEICIGGAGLSHGYLSAPAATAVSFVPDHCSGEPGTRLYRTGDRGRWTDSGVLEFLGRQDGQLKIRGHRIEPAELELALCAHPGVRHAVVTAQLDQEDQPQGLVAYVVPEQDWTLNHSELMRHLRPLVPPYLLPAAIVAIDRVPLTPNGKLDRRALPPVMPESDTALKFASELAQEMAHIWAGLLDVQRVGSSDNFFVLGGHSLRALELAAAVKKRFGIDAPLRMLFENPTVESFTAAVQNLHPASGADSLILRADPEHRYEPFPLTEVQQAYLLGRREDYEFGSVAAHAYVELESSQFDLARFERAAQRLIRRHPMLRAIVHPEGWQQVLSDPPCFRIPLQAQDPMIARSEMSHRVHRTERWPLFDLRISQLDGERLRIHLSLDALIADAHSFRILVTDLSRLYFDDADLLPPIEVTFRDYVLALESRRGTEVYCRAEQYWSGRLFDLPPAPELPVVRVPTRGSSPRFSRRSATVSRDSWLRLQTIAQRVGVTPSVLILGAFSQVIAAWSRQPRFTINLTLFNRLPLHEHVNRIAGDFTSTTLLAVDASNTNTFAEFLRTLQKRLWEDLDHRLFNGVEVLRELSARNGGAPVSMPVVFTSTLDLAQEPEPELMRIAEVVYSITQTPQVWLDHQVFDQDGVLGFNWDFVEELFPPGVVDAMFETHTCLLERLAAGEIEVDAPLPALTPARDLQLWTRINRTSSAVSDATLEDLFLKQAAANPAATALVTFERSLTYDNLERESRALALRLRERGAASGAIVAVVMAKGWKQIVAILGILRAGAAYVPIDASLPPARIDQLLSICNTDLVVRETDLEAGAVPGGTSALDPVCANRLAYIIFTSGSTGQPKGVMIDHRGAVNTVLDINQRFGIGREDRVLGLSSLSFDLSVYDVFGTLAAGGSLVLPGGQSSREPAAWRRLMRDHRVSVWNSVPALLEMLVCDAEGREGTTMPDLRRVMLSGDWIPLSLPNRIRRLAPRAQVISLGGATEASIWSILYPIQTVEAGWRNIPYGKPMRNQTIQVLDHNLEECPVWAEGDLYIGGAGVALGYWRDDELTGRSFIVHPRTGQRLYRTGDAGRLLPDGNIELLGRQDLQVKVNGFRVELTEIEAALNKHLSVRQSAVVACGDRHDRRLVAHVVADCGADQLALYLRSILPDYMVPHDIVILDSLPLNSNGKVDRRKLAATPAAPVVWSAPANLTPAQQRMSEIWRREIGAIPETAAATFFELGGNSLSAVRVLSQVRQEWNTDVPLRLLYENPFLGAFSDAVEQLARKADGALPVLIPPRRHTDEPRLSYVQESLWFAHVAASGPADYNITEALLIEGELDRIVLDQAIQAVVDRNDILRTRFEERGDVPVPWVAPALAVCVAHREVGADGSIESVQRFAQEESRIAFALDRLPLFRITLLNCGDRICGLVFAIHHMLADGISVWLFFDQVRDCYERILSRRPLPQPAEVQYTDFAIWQRRQTASPDGLAFWKSYLADASPLVLRGAAPSEPQRGDSRMVALSPALSQSLRDVARRLGVPPFSVFLAAWGVVLSHTSGSRDFIIGTNIEGRGSPGVQQMLGPFLNQAPVRVVVNDDVDFAAAVQAAHENTLAVLSHQDVPFRQIVETVGRNSLFQVKIDYQDAPVTSLIMGSARLSPVALRSETAHLDLILQATCREDVFLLTALYIRGLIDDTFVEDMLDNLRRTLEMAVEDRHRPLTALLAMLDAAAASRSAAIEEQLRVSRVAALARRAMPVSKPV